MITLEVRETLQNILDLIELYKSETETPEYVLSEIETIVEETIND